MKAKKKTVPNGSDNTDRVVKMFRNITNGFDPGFKTIRHPMYNTLSKRLKMRKAQIYKIVRELQPFVAIKRQDNCSFDSIHVSPSTHALGNGTVSTEHAAKSPDENSTTDNDTARHSANSGKTQISIQKKYTDDDNKCIEQKAVDKLELEKLFKSTELLFAEIDAQDEDMRNYLQNEPHTSINEPSTYAIPAISAQNDDNTQSPLQSELFKSTELLFAGIDAQEGDMRDYLQNEPHTSINESSTYAIPAISAQSDDDTLISSMEPIDLYTQFEKKIVVDNKLIGSSSQIYKRIALETNSNNKAVYLMLKRIHDKKASKRQVEATPCEEKNINQSNEFTDTFQKKFDDANIFELDSRDEMHRKRIVTKSVVKSGWTTKLGTFLFEKTGLSCKFDFKRAWIVDDNVIRTKGTCECGSILEVTSKTNDLRVNIKGIKKDFDHKRKYQLRGQMKEKVIELLKHKTGKPVQVQVVNEIIPNNEELREDFDPVTPGLNALALLRGRLQKVTKDPVDSLLDLSQTELAKTIYFISHSPFCVMYRTPLQLAYYITHAKKYEISLSVDATGSLVTPPKRSQKIPGKDTLKHIFLYQIMLKTDFGKSLPIAQMISQEHTSEFIELFLRKTFKQLKAPMEIVCDEEKGLMKALTVVFVKCNGIISYVEHCMQALTSGAPRPMCYLRIDRSHFVKSITRKIKDSDHRKRHFFQKVIGYLIQCDNFDVAKQIISDFFTLILNEFDGSVFPEKLPCEIAKERLQKLLATYDENNYAEETEDPENSDLEKDYIYQVDVERGWIEDIVNGVVVIHGEPPDYHENVYYSPTQKAFYVNIFSKISLWSNVMSKFFESSKLVPTSSDVESNFKTLKTGIIGRKMMRVDSFLLTHIDYVNAEIKLQAASKKTDPTESKNEEKTNLKIPKMRHRSRSLTETMPNVRAKRSSSNQCDHLAIELSESESDEEHWRGKNKPGKSVMKPRRAIQSILNPSVQFADSIMMFKNGHLSVHGKRTIRTFNTCLFDSFFSLCAGMYADHRSVRNQIDPMTSDCEFSSMIHFMFNGSGRTITKHRTLLQKRNLLLSSIFDGDEFECGLTVVDCQSNANYLIPKLLPIELYSYRREKTCNLCVRTTVSNRCFVDIDFNQFSREPIHNLNKCLLETLIHERSSTCECGGMMANTTKDFSSFIMIDLTLENGIKLISLCDVPKELNMLGNKFALKGCIEFIGQDKVVENSEPSIGHYRSHIYRCNKQWETYDDEKAKVFRSDINSQIKGQVLFYVQTE